VKTLTLILAMLALLGCSVEVPDPKTEPTETEQETTDDEGERETGDDQPMPAKEPKSPKKDQEEGDPEVQVDVDVDVTVNTTVNNRDDDDSERAALGEPTHFNPKAMTWAEAVEAAPEGYHLATRAELVAAYHAGDFDWSKNQVIRVWSADAEDVTDVPQAWCFGLYNGATHMVDADLGMQALYVRD
jgi:hypothetical protein